VLTVMRGSAPIPEALPARFLEAGEPFIAGLAPDAVPRAQLDHRVQLQPLIANEPFSLFHG